MDSFDRVVTRGLGRFFGMAPKIEFMNGWLGQCVALLQVELDDARPDVRPADIHGENGVVPLEHPSRYEVHGADQSAFVRMMVDGSEIHLVPRAFENDRRSTDSELADAASPQAASYHDPFGVAPCLQLEETVDH